MKYWFLDLKIQCGEYEFDSKSVHKGKTFDGEEYAKGFYSDECEDVDGTYFFNGGEIAVEVNRCEEITKMQYNVLKEFV